MVESDSGNGLVTLLAVKIQLKLRGVKAVHCHTGTWLVYHAWVCQILTMEMQEMHVKV